MKHDQLFIDTVTELLAGGQSVRLRGPGFSMHPTIRDDETIVVQPVKLAAIGCSDIILSLLPTGFLAHRVVAIQYAGAERDTSNARRSWAAAVASMFTIRTP